MSPERSAARYPPQKDRHVAVPPPAKGQAFEFAKGQASRVFQSGASLVWVNPKNKISYAKTADDHVDSGSAPPVLITSRIR